jgi:aspartyl-tRNA(Asn)/glutamyl-tRNA(Gln) amidotransferase subunit C
VEGGQKVAGTLATGRTLSNTKVYDCARFFPVFPRFFSLMTLTRKDVESIAHLARLEITEQELPVYVGSLSRIINFVEQLNRAETADVEPMAHPLAGQTQRLRADEVSERDAHELYQRNAPQAQAGLYLVPKLIE